MLRRILLICLLVAMAISSLGEGTCQESGTCSASGEDSPIIPKNANAEGRPHEALKDCVDRHKQCVGFEKQGECTRNPGWMVINCPKSCDACHLRDSSVRCARTSLNMSSDAIYMPGDMDAMFESIESRFGHLYNVSVLSTAPWVVTFEDFLSDDEADALISTVKKWERSTDTGSTNEYGETGRILSTGRTSSNAWCNKECLDVRGSVLSLSFHQSKQFAE